MAFHGQNKILSTRSGLELEFGVERIEPEEVPMRAVLFNTARRTIGGYETMNMLRKGQIEGIGKGDIRGQVRLVADLFKVAA